jgi:RNA polymerase sigma factor (TIGR02999 family)
MAQDADITALLLAWADGEESARAALVDAVYAELRRVAQWHLRHERPGHTLSPSALVHEAYLKVVDQRRVRWQSRAHFFAIAGHVMRRILVDYARARAAAKRDGGPSIALEDVEIGTAPIDIDLRALDAALDKLAGVDPRQGGPGAAGRFTGHRPSARRRARHPHTPAASSIATSSRLA